MSTSESQDDTPATHSGDNARVPHGKLATGNELGSPVTDEHSRRRQLEDSLGEWLDDPALGPLIDEFLQRRRAGENPPLSEFVDRHPEIASAIHGVFPAIAMMQQVETSDTDHICSDLPDLDIRRLGDFRILREIGRGGMGVVYEAVQESLGRRVALKVLPRDLLQGEKKTRRFHREAQVAAALHHTNIVPVFGAGECDGRHFYVMQHIAGQSLEAVIRELRSERTRGRQQQAAKQEQTAKDDPNALVNTPPAGASETPASAAPLASSLLRRNQFESGDRGSGHEGREAAEGEQRSARGNSRAAAESDSTQQQHATSSSIPSGRDAFFFRRVAEIGQQCAEALACAHNAGVLHRDIKPSNLLLDPQGNIWITDFGLAKLNGLSGDLQEQPEGSALTETGDVLGTIRYMPPERLQGAADERSDIYSLGLTIYELLTTEPALKSADRIALLNEVASPSVIPARRLAPAIPGELETIIRTALEPDPASRYQSATALATDFRLFLEGRPIIARPPPWWTRAALWARRNPGTSALLSVIILLLLTLGIGALQAYQALDQRAARIAASLTQVKAAERKSQAARAEERAARLGQQSALIQSLWSEARTLAVSGQVGRKRRGLAIVGQLMNLADHTKFSDTDRHALRNLTVQFLATVDFTMDRRWKHRQSGRAAWFPHWPFTRNLDQYAMTTEEGTIVVRSMDDNRELYRFAGLRPAETDLEPSTLLFSRDGDLVAQLARIQVNGETQDTVAVFRLSDGAEVIRVATGELLAQPFACDFSPDGEQFAVSNDRGGYSIFELDTGEELKHIPVGFGKGQNGCRHLQYSPDGQTIATSRPGMLAGLRTFESPFDQGSRALLGVGIPGSALAWSPDSNYLAGVDGQLIRVWGKDMPDGDSLAFGAPQGVCQSLAFSPDQRWLAAASLGERVHIWNLSTQQSIASLPPHTHVQFSNDGNSMGLSTARRAVERWTVDRSSICRRFGVSPLQARPGFGFVSAVSFSTSGRWLAASTNMGVSIYDVDSGLIVATAPDEYSGAWFAPVVPRNSAAKSDSLALFVSTFETIETWRFDPGATSETERFKSTGHVEIDSDRFINTYTVATSESGRIAFSARDTVHVLDHDLQHVQSVVPAPGDPPTAIQLSPDGTLLAAAPYFGADCFVWGADEGNLLATLPCPAGTQPYLQFSADGRLLAAAVEDELRLYSTETWDVRFRFDDFQHGPGAIAFSPDHQLMAVATSDHIHLYDVSDGTEIVRLRGTDDVRYASVGAGYSLGLTFSRDGRFLAVGTDSYNTEVWDLHLLRQKLAALQLDWPQDSTSDVGLTGPRNN